MLSTLVIRQSKLCVQFSEKVRHLLRVPSWVLLVVQLVEGTDQTAFRIPYPQQIRSEITRVFLQCLFQDFAGLMRNLDLFTQSVYEDVGNLVG